MTARFTERYTLAYYHGWRKNPWCERAAVGRKEMRRGGKNHGKNQHGGGDGTGDDD